MIPLPEPFLNDVYTSWNCIENQNQNLHLEMETLEGRQWVGEEVVGKRHYSEANWETRSPRPETRRWNTEWRLYSKNLGIWDVGTVDLWRRLEPSLSHTSEDGCSPEGEGEPRALREAVSGLSPCLDFLYVLELKEIVSVKICFEWISLHAWSITKRIKKDI